MFDFSLLKDSMDTMLSQGALLSSGDNIMTTGWGLVGNMWRKKVVLIPVRLSRYTHKFIEETGEFTLSVPKEGELKDAIKICGTLSGRDTDKWTAAGLRKQPARTVQGYVVGDAKTVFECRVLTKISMFGADISSMSIWYQNGDLHDLYFAEVVDEYEL